MAFSRQNLIDASGRFYFVMKSASSFKVDKMKAEDFLKSAKMKRLVKSLEGDKEESSQLLLLMRNFMRDELAFVINRADELAGKDQDISHHLQRSFAWICTLEKICRTGFFWPLNNDPNKTINDWKQAYGEVSSKNNPGGIATYDLNCGVKEKTPDEILCDKISVIVTEQIKSMLQTGGLLHRR